MNKLMQMVLLVLVGWRYLPLPARHLSRSWRRSLRSCLSSAWLSLFCELCGFTPARSGVKHNQIGTCRREQKC